MQSAIFARYKDKVKILQKANKLKGTNIFMTKISVEKPWSSVNSCEKK